MADVTLPITTAPGSRPGEGAGRLINCYADPLVNGARSAYARKPVPGLKRLTKTTDATNYVGIRGYHEYNGDLYVAVKNRLQRVNLSGGVYTTTDLGSLPGTKRVTFARNNKTPVADILCTTENDTYVVHQASAPTSLSDPDLPQAIAMDFMDGYFVATIRDGRYFVSDLNATGWGALNFGSAQSKPGGLYRAVCFNELLYLCGPSDIEVWQNVGNASGSPFSRSAIIPHGIVGTFAIAGNELGFGALIFVSDDNGVYRIDSGYQETKISDAYLDGLIAKVSDKTQIDVTVYVVNGHQFAAVSGPDFTWEYQLSTGLWHERASYLDDHWRAVCAVAAFGGWVIGDRKTGDIWMLDADRRYEGDNQLVVSVISAPGSAFPNRTIIPRVDFDIIVGQGIAAGLDPIEAQPVCMISWSDDGGTFFKTPLKRALGRQGTPQQRISVNRTGMSGPYGRVWRIDVADPVYVAFLSGTMDNASAVSR